jgi:type IV pilus assembly protein PilP
MRMLVSGLSLMLALRGCDDEPIRVGRGRQAAPVGPAPEPASDGDAGVDSRATLRQYRDEDFVEADTNRDPFRNYAASFQAVATAAGPATTRTVRLSDTSIEEMRLIAIVSGVADPRAMIVDREGVGHTVRRGEYIGRPEIVQAGGIEELPVTLNWRVDRIRPNEVVLTREDPTAPNRPPLTRVLPLRDDDPRTP